MEVVALSGEESDEAARATAWGGFTELGGLVGLGTDLVEVERLATALARRPGLEARLFTGAERAWCTAAARPSPRFAARFAAKEATMKALGVGLGGVGWHDVEVVRAAGGQPDLVLQGRAATRAEVLGVRGARVSLTHTAAMAQAVVVLLG